MGGDLRILKGHRPQVAESWPCYFDEWSARKLFPEGFSFFSRSTQNVSTWFLGEYLPYATD